MEYGMCNLITRPNGREKQKSLILYMSKSGSYKG